jgi:hypothetical protein
VDILKYVEAGKEQYIVARARIRRLGLEYSRGKVRVR